MGGQSSKKKVVASIGQKWDQGQKDKARVNEERAAQGYARTVYIYFFAATVRHHVPP